MRCRTYKKLFSRRVSASLLNAVGLQELITYSEKEYEDFVKPVGNIVFTTTCGMLHPLEMEILIGERKKKYQKEYEMYKREHYPFSGLTWDNPRACVMEVDYIKEKEKKD